MSTREQIVTGEAKAHLVEQINACLRSGDYPRALDLARGAAAEFADDAEISELEKRAHDGVKRSAEANRLITESQELFAQQKSGEAIQLLRKAYELDKNNSLARAILANALVEHAQSMVETDWLEAEKLTNQALALNRLHPTAKNILNSIVERKRNSSVDEWVSQACKFQSAGDLFTALAWVAEGLAVHPDDSKLLQAQDSIQRDQSARRRQSRRRDLDDLRRIQREVEAATDLAAKQALAERIQAIAANYWTDGEILSIANALLLRLGLAAQDTSGASARGKSSPLIFYVPRPGASKPSSTENQAAPSVAIPAEPPPKGIEKRPKPVQEVPQAALPKSPPPAPVATNVAPEVIPASEPAPSKASLPSTETAPLPTPQPPPAPLVAATPVIEKSEPLKKTSSAPQRKRPAPSKLAPATFIAAAVVVLVVAILFFVSRQHRTAATNVPATSIAQAPAVSAPPVLTPEPLPTTQTPAAPEPEQSLPAATPAAADIVTEKPTPNTQAPPTAGRHAATLIVVAGQDDAHVTLNGKPQHQATQAGQLRLPNLEPGDYVVKISKTGFQDSPEQKIRIRDGEDAKLIFSLQPQVHLASLSIQGGSPGTAVLLDQSPIGAIQADGTFSASNLNPGDHTIELRKDRFKPRQFKKHFDGGGSVSLNASDVALEAAPAELKITFTPPDASVALVKGDLLKIVSSGVPLNLPAGTYTLTARTAERFTRWATLEIIAGQSKTLDLSLSPNGMSKWDDPSGWKHEGDSFTRKGGDFVLYGVVPTSGTLSFTATPVKGRMVQWVLNYVDEKNYMLLQIDENNFYRSVIRNGQKSDEIIVPHKLEKKALRTLQIRVSATEIVHQIKQGDSWRVLDRWTQPGINLGAGKFGFYIPGSDQIAISGLAHYADLNVR